MSRAEEQREKRAEQLAEQDRQWREQGWREAGSVPGERAGWGLDEAGKGSDQHK